LEQNGHAEGLNNKSSGKLSKKFRYFLLLQRWLMEIQKETSRLEAFSDGVFGFAITLLVLDAHVPLVSGDQTLFQLLVAEWATYLAFLIGFFTILICWINHHFMFDYIYKSNSRLLLFNGFKLLVVTFTPFATAVLSKYINTLEQGTAVSLYTFNFALMGLAMFWIWLYASRKGLMKAEAPIPLKKITQYYFLAAAMSVSIFILSFINIWLCLGLSGVMFIIFLFPEQMLQYVVRTSRKRLR
jgi:uncharacterized membrane protein